jgi:hypothetical protein
MIIASRQSIKQDLLAYGENDLAMQIEKLSDDDLNKIGELAAKHIEQGGFISKHVALGAIEFIEGKQREPKRKSRNMSVYNIEEPEPKENILRRILNGFKKR